MTVIPQKERRINFEEISQGNTLLLTSLWIVLAFVAAFLLIVGISYAGEVEEENPPQLIYPAARL